MVLETVFYLLKETFIKSIEELKLNKIFEHE
jgi:hypothetical protein